MKIKILLLVMILAIFIIPVNSVTNSDNNESNVTATLTEKMINQNVTIDYPKVIDLATPYSQFMLQCSFNCSGITIDQYIYQPENQLSLKFQGNYDYINTFYHPNIKTIKLYFNSSVIPISEFTELPGEWTFHFIIHYNNLENDYYITSLAGAFKIINTGINTQYVTTTKTTSFPIIIPIVGMILLAIQKKRKNI